MRVELVSIGDELLRNEVLDTNAAHSVRCLRELGVRLTCRVTVGDDPDLIANALRVGLQRADVVLASGGLGTGRAEFTLEAVAKTTGRDAIDAPPGIAGATLLQTPRSHTAGFRLETPSGTLICLPAHYRDMAYLLETDVLPYLQQQMPSEATADWILLRTAGLMESSIRQQIEDVPLTPRQRISFSSYAGQTDIRLSIVETPPEQAKTELNDLADAIRARLGDHVYGRGRDRLEEILVRHMARNGVQLSVAECETGRSLARTLQSVSAHEEVASFLPTQGCGDLARDLNLPTITGESDLTRWCRKAAERLQRRTRSDVGMLIYNNTTRSGVQILVTLAARPGVSMMQRSFGGHPGNIDDWASTLGLVHLRRWLLAYYPEDKDVEV